MAAKIGIIGGGIAGLSCAYRLATQGHQVTVLESSPQLGGLGTFFEHQGRQIDRFYHCIMPSDDYFLQLIEDLGLSDRLYWQKTFMGMVYQGHHYPFNSALDLLRFTPLSFLQRVRLGAMSLLLKYLGNDQRLDYTPMGDWLTQLFGSDLWDLFWQPLFAAKFGAKAGELPGLYLKKRLGRESNVGERGYLQGGLYGFIKALAEAIAAHGGHLVLEQPVLQLQQSDSAVIATTQQGTFSFDALISTIPLHLLAEMAQGIDGAATLPKLTYQGVINLLIFLDRPVTGYYWTPILRSQTGFDGMVESSALIAPDHYGGYHAAYLMKYTHPQSDLYQRATNTLEKEWLEQFLDLYAPLGITPDNIVDTRLFRTPYVEPIYPLGYSRYQPRIRLGQSRIYLATTAQVYPYITSWNSSIRVAAACVTQLLRNL
ncbi:FAD-dependent oxidoreductase [Lyngbya confervoides]|uniref:FAD-dependent oxidoreductase n=1 Tax=Lyngbya confervoides BDU141951 TaxID=1574623 RepID=A0ABD4T7U2_9CYAN|nr:FAD-dependent oxidoreductase [Lyngbya confervoides]MCM1984691.1 FAD-dependent oxidoreductase [Lyngbya confervoides BDU141951]